jgi:hypothetical protein
MSTDFQWFFLLSAVLMSASREKERKREREKERKRAIKLPREFQYHYISFRHVRGHKPTVFDFCVLFNGVCRYNINQEIRERGTEHLYIKALQLYYPQAFMRHGNGKKEDQKHQ